MSGRKNNFITLSKRKKTPKYELRLKKLAANFANKQLLLSEAKPNTKQHYPLMRGKRWADLCYSTNISMQNILPLQNMEP